jgi:Tfp pilus assembly protein FimT
MTIMPSRCAGRSMVELLVAVGIAALLTAVAVPSYSFLVDESRINSAADDFHNMLFKARSEAVKRGQTVHLASLAGSNSWAQGARMFVDTDNDGVQDAGEQTLFQSGPVTGPYTLSSTLSSLRYLSSGTLTISPAVVNFTLCKNPSNADPGRVITISQTGRPSVTESTCS